MKKNFNRSEIMKAVWVDFRQRNADYAARGWTRRDPFRMCLSYAWMLAKKEAARVEAGRKDVAQKAEADKQQAKHLEWYTKEFPNTEFGRVNKRFSYLR